MIIKIKDKSFTIPKTHFKIFDILEETVELELHINANIFQKILDIFDNKLDIIDISTIDIIEILKIIDYLDIECLFDQCAIELSKRIERASPGQNIIPDILHQLDVII